MLQHIFFYVTKFNVIFILRQGIIDESFMTFLS